MKTRGHSSIVGQRNRRVADVHWSANIPGVGKIDNQVFRAIDSLSLFLSLLDFISRCSRFYREGDARVLFPTFLENRNAHYLWRTPSSAESVVHRENILWISSANADFSFHRQSLFFRDSCDSRATNKRKIRIIPSIPSRSICRVDSVSIRKIIFQVSIQGKG